MSSRRRLRVALRLGCLLAMILALTGSFAQAQDSAKTGEFSIADIDIGFGANGGSASSDSSQTGHYKVGLWTPVNVTLNGDANSPTSGILEIESTDGDGFASLVQSGNITVPAGAQVRRQLLLRPGSQGGAISVRFRAVADSADLDDPSRGEVLAEKTADLAAMLTSQRLWVQVGADMRVGDAMRSHDFGDEGAIEVAQVMDLNELPTEWFGYEGVDILFVSVADPAMREQLRGNARIEALDHWVKSGGHLVLAIGAESAEASSFFVDGNDPHPLLRFLPGTFDRMTEITQTQELLQFVDSPEPFEIGDSYRLPVIVEQPGSLVKKRLQTAPLVLQAAYGFGKVTFTPVDWHQPPFSRWSARDRFINAVLGLPVGGTTLPEEEDTGQLSHAGLTDMASQLRSGLDQFPNVTIVPFWAIALAIFGYIVLIGPVDYFLVKRGFRKRDGHARMELTWMTLPIWVILVSGVAYWMANRTKGDNLHVNQLIVEDHDLQTGAMRGSAWYSVFSPAMASYDVRLDTDGSLPVDTKRQLMTSWMGLPGRVLGGLAQDDTLLIGRAEAYRYTDGYSQLQGTPVPVWSSRCFTSRWMAEDQSPPLEVNVTATSLGDARPDSTIRNVSGYDLQNCLFVYHRWAYLLPDLADGESIRLSSSKIEKRNLRDYLNNERKVKDEESNRLQSVFEPYDVLNRDVPAIARSMSLYGASGGKGYTQLENRYLSFMDLTPQVDIQRGVLIGFAASAQPLAEVQAESSSDKPQEQVWKLLRFTFDVPIGANTPSP